MWTMNNEIWIFLKLFHDEIVDLRTCETNRYADQYIKKGE